MLIPISQIAISVFIVILILFQERSSGISGLLGGDGGGVYQTRRGLEKIIFWATIVLVAAFLALAIFELIR